MWCIAELGLPCRRIDAGHRYGVTDTAEFLAMNPNGTIPVLRDGAHGPLRETGAILRYLAGRYGASPFWPAGDIERAHVDKWAEWSKLNVVGNFMVPIFWQVVRTRPADRDPVAVTRAVATLDRYLDIAATQLSSTAFLAGDAFTLADIQLGHMLHRYFDIPIARKERPELQRYHAALRARPSFLEHVVVSYDELRVSS